MQSWVKNMYFRFRNLKNKDKESSDESSESHGILKVDVPHWSSQVQIFDDSFNPVAGVETINADPKSSSGYSTETKLPPGVYQIKTSLEGETESEWVPVRPDRLTQVTTDAWKNLEFTSATPLGQIKNAAKTQIKAAEKMSRQLTWKDSQGDGGLFLFVRTSDPQKYGKNFIKGLELFDENENLITDFSENVKHNKSEGWLAFNADLPNGSYILRRRRQGVKPRYQIVYVCPNWQTEVYIQSRSYPSLGTMNVNMKRHRSLPQNAEAAEAAETVLNFLRYKTDVRLLFNGDKMKAALNILLDAERGNPWLGVLTAYSIFKLEEEFSGEQNRETTVQQKDSFEEYFSLLRQKLIPFLKRMIPSHPDVRALLIGEMAESLAFPFPPMLWVSLKRIQSYSTRHANIVPENCLTDCVIDSPLIDSPWSAWSYLKHHPENFSGFSKLETIPPAVFRSVRQKRAFLPEIEFQPLAGESGFSPQFQSDEALTFTPDQQFLQEVSVIQTAKDVVHQYVESGMIGDIPEIYELNSSGQINEMLGRVEARQMSVACNIPLSRAENDLENLKKQGETLSLSGQSDDAAIPPDLQNSVSETPLGQAIISFAVNPANQSADSESECPTALPLYEIPKIKIENLVSQIRTSAERLWLLKTQSEKNISSALNISEQSFSADEEIPLSVEESKFAGKIALELKSISDNLLSRADLIVITDSQHKIFNKNDAFLFLLLPQTPGIPSSAELVGDLSVKQAKWENLLESLPLGESEIENPSNESFTDRFLVRRTLIQDRQTNLQAYLNIIHAKNMQTIEDEKIEEISRILSDLTLFTSLFAYGTSTGKNEYQEKLENIVARLVDLTGEKATNN